MTSDGQQLLLNQRMLSFDSVENIVEVRTVEAKHSPTE